MSEAKSNLPLAKQTAQELYVTSKEAYEKWQANPEIKIIDVRTPEEFLFVGHPPMAWLIPVIKQNYAWDAEKSNFPMGLLPDFVERVQQVIKPDEVFTAS
jgi:rhodanese-related sulfurtransferase